MAGRIWKAIAAARAAYTAITNTETTTALPIANLPTPFGTGNSGMRSSAAFWPLRDLREAKPQDRRTSQQTSRWLRNRLGLVKALMEGSARHALGEGLSPSANSGDTEYDKRADDLFDQIANRKGFDIRQEHTFYRMQPLLLQDMICDGDAGAAKVRSPDNRPCLQLFSAEAIDNTGTEAMSEGWREGILRNLEGAAIKYRIIKENLPGQYSGPRRHWDYRADEFLHLARFDRLNINRPMPWLNHGHGSCVTMLDLRELELKVAVLNSYFAGAITTPDGETPDAILEAVATRRGSKTHQTADGTTTTEETVRKYAEFFGGAALPVLKEGEKLEFFKNDRASTTFTGFIDWLVNDIAWGLGVPPQFVWTVMGMTGPNARLILQQSEWFFKHLQSLMVERFCQPVWESLIAEALNRGILKAPKPGAVWNAVHWQGPQSMTIDKGRDGQLFKELVNGGMMSRSEWHEMNAKHGRNHRRRIIDELAEDLAYCQEKKVPMEIYFGTAPGQMGAAGATPPQGDPRKTAEAVVNMLEEQGWFRQGRN